MQLQTTVSIPKPSFTIQPCEEMIFVGSCFADNIGRRFVEEKFRANVNPFGVMYNPASILHTIQRIDDKPKIAVFTLGTNHVYIFKETGIIVDNCEKKPHNLFIEKALSIDDCASFLSESIDILLSRCEEVKIILTVSPIRYAKYGFHESQLSKSVLLLAADAVANKYPDIVSYFPAYELMNDELRDYRFYASDMIHPSEQAVDYIYERFADTYFSDNTRTFLKEWQPIKRALAHRPFNSESEEYKKFRNETIIKYNELAKRYPLDSIKE